MKRKYNNHIHSDSKKRRSFVALLFAAGDVGRYALGKQGRLMGLFDFLKGKQKILGSIGYFGLEEWWLSELTDRERKYIQETYQPMGTGSSSLTEGNISSTSQTAIGLVSGMVGWFAKKEDRPIAYKLIEKVEKLIDSNSRILDVHFFYGTKIEILYKDRDVIPNGLEYAIEACEQQISYSKKAANAFLSEYKESPLPSHKGYQKLAIVREKQKKYEETIKVCEQALSQGWAGDWEKRIARCKKKQNA